MADYISFCKHFILIRTVKLIEFIKLFQIKIMLINVELVKAQVGVKN